MKRKTTKKLAVLCIGVALLGSNQAAERMPLDGLWRFQLDRADVGMNERWFASTLPAHIQLPGSLPAQSIGDDVTLDTQWRGGIVDRSWFTAPEYTKYRQPGNIKVPFWLQPEKYYAGVAWYQRDIEIPATWSGKRVVLSLERPHWETRVWVDEKPWGANNSLATPHDYDLGQLSSGKHTLTIRVDNRMVVDIGENSHSVSDHTQGNWNGIVGEIELRATPPVWIDDIQVYPDVAKRTVLIKGKLGNMTGRSGSGEVGLKLMYRESARPVKLNRVLVCWTPEGGVFELELPVAVSGEPTKMWDEFSPALYWIEAYLNDMDPIIVPFGLREFAAQGTQFTINGCKTFIRGTLDCCIYPKTGHPPMDVAEWMRIIGVAKAHGLNLLRFHSWCPPEAAFAAADELGFYFQIETCWANQSTTLGDGKPVDAWVYAETERILRAYGNHPSFILMPYGNEPGGKQHAAYLAKWVEHFKSQDSRRLFTSGAGWPELPENQWHCTPGPRIQAWGGGLKSRINAQPPETTSDYRDYIGKRNVPVVSHEIGQWCVYPNFDEIPKYTGYLKPKNFEIFRDRLAEHHMQDLAHHFLLASGKLQALCYKEDIESALRTPGMGGFELLDLHDFPGQGTALVGVLDPFWEEKGYMTAADFSRFCNSTVPLARLKKRVFTTDEKLEAELEVAHFGPLPITPYSCKPGFEDHVPPLSSWKMTADNGSVLAAGKFTTREISVGNTNRLGQLELVLNKLPAPAHYKLSALVDGYMWTNGFTGQSSIRAENDWDIWVYPAQAATEPAKDILVTTQYGEAAQKHLASGGKLLLTLPDKSVRNFDTAPVQPGFSSIFWNTAWTGHQAPTTLGILCDPKHPALAGFPTDFHSNWQWWYLLHRAGALRLDLLPKGVEPIVRVIDDWFTARPLGLVVEGKAGAGKVIICGFDLTHGADDPVSHQMRASLLTYMASPDFNPTVELTTNDIARVLCAPPVPPNGPLRAARPGTRERRQVGGY